MNLERLKNQSNMTIAIEKMQKLLDESVSRVAQSQKRQKTMQDRIKELEN